MSNPLVTLLDLSEHEKNERGLQHTPREIAQQPETWLATHRLCADHKSELSAVLRQAGIGRGSGLDRER